MASPQDNFPWEYLRKASVPSLESFELSRLSHAANLRKEIAALVDQWLEETASALLARWLLQHWDQLHALNRSRDEAFELEPKPLRKTPAALAAGHRSRRGAAD